MHMAAVACVSEEGWPGHFQGSFLPCFVILCLQDTASTAMLLESSMRFLLLSIAPVILVCLRLGVAACILLSNKRFLQRERDLLCNVIHQAGRGLRYPHPYLQLQLSGGLQRAGGGGVRMAPGDL